MTRFIAEIGSNHNRDAQRCSTLIRASADAGCDAVKLQVFRVEELFSPEALAQRPELLERRAWEFPLELLGRVREQCDEIDVELGATPFSLRAVEELVPWVDFLKVASYELLWHRLIEECAASGKPLVISTGMATLDEIRGAVGAAHGAGCPSLTLLHCVSAYPAPPDESNLAVIDTLRKEFGHEVGWSDHSQLPAVVERAVSRWGASVVELHIDVDGAGYESGEHCWQPSEVARLIAACSDRSQRRGEKPPGVDIQALDGDGEKRPMPSELPDRPWRADPQDGLRPLAATRALLSQS